MTPSKPQQVNIAAPAAPTPPPPASSPTGGKPKQKSQTPTSLPAAALPSQSDKGFKTLLGQ